MTKRVNNDSERKRRPDSWEIKLGLTDAQLSTVFGWARTLGYAAARDLIRKEFKKTPPSMSSFGAWYSDFSRGENEQRIHQAIADGAAVKELARECGDISEAMAATLEAEASAAILAKDMNRIKPLVRLALQARQGRFEEKKYKDAMKSSIERGLDALAEQIQGNKKALDLYATLKAAVMKSVEDVK